jgi:hypothetical protein
MSSLYGHTAAGVRDVREMVRRAQSGRFDKGFRWHPSGGSRPVVVRLDEDIDEDDADEHPAEVLELRGGAWQGTKQYVMVRNAGSLEIEKDAKLSAIPIPNVGLCVCAGRRPGVFQPLNVGILENHYQALTYDVDFNVTWGVRDGYTHVWPNSSTYHRLTPEHLLRRDYMLNESQRLHVLALGMAPGAPSEGRSIRLTNSSSAEAVQRAFNLTQSSWIPEPGSLDDIAIAQYLADGGTVIVLADQWPVYVDAPGYFTGELLQSGTRFVWYPILDQQAKLNAWLDRIGSSVRILAREQFVATLPAAPPQFPIDLVSCSHVPLLPPNGVFSVNPDVWLGRSPGLRRLMDRRQFAKFAEMDRTRGGGYQTMAAAGTINTAFQEINGAWSPTIWMPYGNQNDPFSPETSPWTLGQMFGISAPSSIWFTATHIGQRYWTNRFQWGPPLTGLAMFRSGTQLFGWEFFRLADNMPHIDPATVFALPTATAERLPNGGRLIVTTQAAFQQVAEALTRSIQSGDMLELTSHFVGSRNATLIDAAGRTVHTLSSSSRTLPRFTNVSIDPRRIPSRAAYAIGPGIKTVATETGRSSSGVMLTQLFITTLPEPEEVPQFAYRPRADITKANWSALDGGSSMWPEVSEEVPDDADGVYSAVGSSSPLVLRLEPIEPPASSAPITITFRAAKCDAAGAPTSAGTASVQIELVGNTSSSVYSAFTATLTDTVQDFTWTFDSYDTVWAFERGTNPQIRIRPTTSGCGALVTYFALNAGRAGSFDAMLMSVSCDTIALTTNLGACPWAHSWKGIHPTFDANQLFYQLRFAVAYSEDDLAAWGHIAAGLVKNSDEFSNEGGGAPKCLSFDRYWRLAQTLQTPLHDRMTGAETITAMVVQRPSGADPQLSGPGGGTLDCFPVLFQNGRFLRPVNYEEVTDFHELQWPEFNDRSQLFHRSRARVSLKGWQDITHWPEIPEELVDIETDPDSPPVCVGVGTVASLKYGVDDPQKYIAAMDYALIGLDFAIQSKQAVVRNVWLDNYGGGA